MHACKHRIFPPDMGYLHAEYWRQVIYDSVQAQNTPHPQAVRDNSPGLM